jgi:hypothetical protein
MFIKHWPHIKILVVSGLMDAQTIKLPFGATFFSKPYEHGKFVDLARQHSA